MCVSASVGDKWDISGCQASYSARQVSQCLFLTYSQSNTNARSSASSFTSACARYVPSLSVNKKLRRSDEEENTHTHTHRLVEAHAFSRGMRREGMSREEGEEEVASHPSVQYFSSFRLVPFIRQFFPFCGVPCAAAVRPCPPLFSCPLFLCAPSFFSLTHRLPFFPIHPLLSFFSPRSSFQELSALVTAQGVRRAKVGSE